MGSTIKASAIHYSLIETAKANNLEPYGYLTQILKALPYADTVEKIEALLPWNFKKNGFCRIRQVHQEVTAYH